MKKKMLTLYLTALLTAAILAPSLTALGKKPLRCEKTLDIYPDEPDGAYMKGWITGDIEGWFVVYHLGPPKITGQVTHYQERWAIFETEDMDHELMSGHNTAMVIARKLVWWAQGVVEYVDNGFEGGRYADLLGDRWHSYGIIISGLVPDAYTRLVDTAFRMN